MPFVHETTFDWLTTTWPATSEGSPVEQTKEMYTWAKTTSAEYGGEFELKRWSWNGYTGWAAGTVSWGERFDGTILRLSGIMADAWLISGKPTGHNVSRLDVATTVWGCYDIDKQLALHKEQALEYRKALHSRPFKVRGIDGCGDGDTLYVGRRSSEMMLRIYNKEKEQSGDERYATAIRYETELKGSAASEVLERWRDAGGNRGALQSLQMGFLQRRGVEPIVAFSDERRVVVSPTRLRTDVETSLQWLEEQVSPTIRRLIAQGHRDRLIVALGLEQRSNDDGRQ